METIYNDAHGVTLINLNKFTYTWSLINFRDTMKKLPQPKIQSPWFKIDSSEHKICMHLDFYSDWTLSFCHQKKRSDISMHYTVSLIDKNENKRFTREATSYDNSIAWYPTFKNFLYNKHLTESKDLLPNGNLTIRCTIYYNQKIVSMENSMEIFHEKKQSSQQEVSEYFEELFETGKFSDVKLVVKNKIFLAHKNILAMRSPVFSAMFEHKMKEQQENLVIIADVNYDVMKEVLRYIYTKKIQNFSTLGIDIFIAADKYAIDELKNLCEQKFICELSIKRIPQLLILIDNYDVNNLKKFVFEFLRITATDITKKELFEKSSISYSALSDIVKALSLKE